MPENYEQELKTINVELRRIEQQLRNLNEQKEELKIRKEFLVEALALQQSKAASEDSQWESNNFSWHSKVLDALEKIFKLSSFRSNQLAAINATLSKKDTILIMPTGGGKSLCYQLPAIVDKGFTLVISPMVSLIEDQFMQLKALSISVEMFTASTTRQESTRIMDSMTNPRSGLKLVYVTPEKLAKSKRFMSKLQKSYANECFSRIAVDEVHCCSQWGHDFRTDYQFLSVLKGMFPDVPIIGLTATATTKVIVDIQKMLTIQGCIIFKSSFNRPNLFYEVREKPSSGKDCVDQLEDLLKHRFRNKSGIVYTSTIKDLEDLRNELRNRGCKVSGYHAQLEPELRSKIHKKWLSGEYQAVVATIAFGLGIDKADVRFVIHHSISKSMENFYQESGRAGRDGQRAESILFFRFADIFKLSTLVFAQKTGLRNLYSTVEYCLNTTDCRRKIIASHFDELWESTDCNLMCDHCKRPHDVVEKDVAEYCRSIYKILEHAFQADVRLTGQMILDTWYGKGNKIKTKVVAAPACSVETAGNIVAFLLINNYLQEDFHFTPYSTISYLKKGPKASLVGDGHRIVMILRGKRHSSAVVPTDKVPVDEEKNEKRTKDSSASTSCKKAQPGAVNENKRNASATKECDTSDENDRPNESSKRRRVFNVDSEGE